MVHLITLSPTVGPELWFKQAEALFTAHNIAHEKMKFGHIVRVLAVQYASEVVEEGCFIPVLCGFN